MRNIVDQQFEVSLSRPGANEESKLTVSVSSELMEYTLQGALLSADESFPLNVVEDSNGNSMVFAVMKDHQLHLVLNINGSETGWKAVNLSDKAANEPVVTYTVSQNRSGGVMIALATAEGSSHRLWVSEMLPNTAGDYERWEGMEWIQRPDSKPHRIGSLHLGTNDDKAGFPMLVAATQDAEGHDKAQHYIVQTAPNVQSGLWEQFPMPENAQEILALTPGSHALGRGVYTLYRKESALRLVFTSVKDSYGKTHNVELPVPQGARSLDALAAGSKGFTDLYIGGDGIYRIPARNQSSVKSRQYVAELADAATTAGIKQIIVRDDEDKVSVWGLSGDNRLHYISGLKNVMAAAALEAETADEMDEGLMLGAEDTAWEKSIVIRSGVTALAPIRNSKQGADTVLMKEGENKLLVMAQAPETRLWSSTSISLPDDGQVRKLKAFATKLHMKKADGSPYFPELEQKLSEREDSGTNAGAEPLQLRLSASDYVQLEVNGISYALNKGEAATIAPDAYGDISIITFADDISTPMLHVDHPSLGSRITINPAAKVHDGLDAIKSVDDLGKVKLQDGRDLVDASRRDNLDSAVKGVLRLQKVASDLPKDGTVANAYLPNEAESGGGRWSGAFGMSYSPEEGLKYYEEEDAHMMMSSAVAMAIPGAANGDWFEEAVTRFAGDVLAWARNALHEAYEFIVVKMGPVWQFALKIGRVIYKFTMNCLSHLYSSLSWLLENTLGIDLDKIIGWLGFLFNWDDILATKRVLVQAVNNNLEFGRNEIRKAEKKVDKFFDDIVHSLKNRRGELKDLKGVHATLQSADKGRKDEAAPEGKKALQFMDQSPAGHYSSYLMRGGVMHEKVLASLQAPHVMNDSYLDRLRKLFNDTIVPTLHDVEEDVKRFGQDFQQLFTDKELSVTSSLEMLAGDAAIGLLNLGKNMIVSLFKVIEEILHTVEDLINKDVNLPIISAFYKEFAKSDKMSLLDIISLLLAIPSTSAYKLLKGKAPFPKDGGELASMDSETFFRRIKEEGLLAEAPEGSDAAGNGVDIMKLYSYIGGLASASMYHIWRKAEVVATCMESKIPAAVESPFCLLQVALTIPLGKWTDPGNLFAWAVKWAFLIKNLYDICFPGESKAGHILKIIISVIAEIANVAKFIYAVYTDRDKAGRIVLATWKGIEDLITFIGNIVGAVAGLLPPSTPYGGKYIAALVGCGALELSTGSAVLRTGATILADELMYNS
ncbi:hypothetical protein [Paenibacillus oenotherae]|uniref:hypothetical protein n=1 Tax=Paenibacillus oenotherae TaxID=1435645 RepID=UPI001FE28D4D|nr:hypothetical protein [Paenibacillus oenotherae]